MCDRSASIFGTSAGGSVARFIGVSSADERSTAASPCCRYADAAISADTAVRQD